MGKLTIPDDPNGAWVTQMFEAEVSLSESGSYGLFVDNISSGGSSGYNEYGVVRGNLLAAGRYWNIDKDDLKIGGTQIFDIAFQLFGSGANQNIPLRHRVFWRYAVMAGNSNPCFFRRYS